MSRNTCFHLLLMWRSPQYRYHTVIDEANSVFTRHSNIFLHFFFAVRLRMLKYGSRKLKISLRLKILERYNVHMLFADTKL